MQRPHPGSAAGRAQDGMHAAASSWPPPPLRGNICSANVSALSLTAGERGPQLLGGRPRHAAVAAAQQLTQGGPGRPARCLLASVCMPSAGESKEGMACPMRACEGMGDG